MRVVTPGGASDLYGCKEFCYSASQRDTQPAPPFQPLPFLHTKDMVRSDITKLKVLAIECHGYHLFHHVIYCSYYSRVATNQAKVKSSKGFEKSPLKCGKMTANRVVAHFSAGVTTTHHGQPIRGNPNLTLTHKCTQHTDRSRHCHIGKFLH